MKKCMAIAGFIAAATIAGAASADTVTFNGVLEDGDGIFDSPHGSSTPTEFLFDAVEFSVDADGEYGFYSFYPGNVDADENMDGLLILYTGSFDPANPDNSTSFDDDYTAGDVAILAGFDGDAVGQNASGFAANLVAGETYFLVQTTFSDSPTSFGQPNGPYESVITGPGNISIIPAPAAFALLGLGGLAVSRRRRG